MSNILILTSGKVEKLDAFVGVDKGSFAEINYVLGQDGDYTLMCGGRDLRQYKVIYFRLVGKSLEIATLVANYAKDNGTKIVDELYGNNHLMPSSLGKSIELVALFCAGIKIPKTVFGDFSRISFPFVVKSTTGQKAREVWLVKDEAELKLLSQKFDTKKSYFAQELIPNAKRIRTLVVGGKVLGGVVRSTKWNRDMTKETLEIIPPELIEISLKSARAVRLDICGVDILTNETGVYWVIEANAAPTWKIISKQCSVNVEDEIINYLQTKI